MKIYVVPPLDREEVKIINGGPLDKLTLEGTNDKEQRWNKIPFSATLCMLIPKQNCRGRNHCAICMGPSVEGVRLFNPKRVGTHNLPEIFCYIHLLVQHNITWLPLLNWQWKMEKFLHIYASKNWVNGKYEFGSLQYCAFYKQIMFKEKIYYKRKLLLE